MLRCANTAGLRLALQPLRPSVFALKTPQASGLRYRFVATKLATGRGESQPASIHASR